MKSQPPPRPSTDRPPRTAPGIAAKNRRPGWMDIYQAKVMSAEQALKIVSSGDSVSSSTTSS